MNNIIFKTLVHYICSRGEGRKFGATKLNKILWFSDTFWYRMYGKSITGETYIKNKFGPVPKSIRHVLNDLIENQDIEEVKGEEYIPNSYRARTHPSIGSHLNQKQIELVDYLIDSICEHHTAASISELTHDQIWKAAFQGEEIPMYAVLASDPAEITNDDLEWAEQRIDDYLR